LSQHDLNIANQGFPAFRADLNDALVALGSTNSGATAPATPYANQLWYDTANNILKIRNEDNDAWISIVTLDQSGDVVSAITAATVNAGALNATGVTTVQSGTASAPAIITSGDANTGIFFPSGDTTAFSQGGTEAMRINASRNLTIGKTDIATNVDGFAVLNNGETRISCNANDVLNLNRNTSNGAIQRFFRSGSLIGLIEGATTGLTYTGINGITFTATQTPNADANTLDDYEEGTWTPTLVSTGGGAPSYSTREGRYYKIGGIVYVFGIIQISGTLPAGNYTRIQGLPFTQSSVESAAAIKYSGATTVPSGQFITAAIGGSEISFARCDGNGEIGATGLNASYISTTFRVSFSTFYQVA
jgi:hypothetical protein